MSVGIGMGIGALGGQATGAGIGSTSTSGQAANAPGPAGMAPGNNLGASGITGVGPAPTPQHPPPSSLKTDALGNKNFIPSWAPSTTHGVWIPVWRPNPQYDPNAVAPGSANIPAGSFTPQDLGLGGPSQATLDKNRSLGLASVYPGSVTRGLLPNFSQALSNRQQFFSPQEMGFDLGDPRAYGFSGEVNFFPNQPQITPGFNIG